MPVSGYNIAWQRRRKVMGRSRAAYVLTSTILVILLIWHMYPHDDEPRIDVPNLSEQEDEHWSISQPEAGKAVEALRGQQANLSPEPRQDDRTEYLWIYEYDAHDLSLANWQCDLAFEQLYTDIDLMIHRHDGSRHKIKKEDVDRIPIDEGMARAAIFGQHLYLVDVGQETYGLLRATLSQINRAVLTSREEVPNIEFVITVNDHVSSRNQWAFSRGSLEGATWLMPDSGVWKRPDLKAGGTREEPKRMEDMDLRRKFAEKKSQKAFWRGDPTASRLREQLLQVAAGEAWADVQAIDVRKPNETSTNISLADMCKHRHLIHAEGSSGPDRLTTLQMCDSVIITPYKERTTFTSHLLTSSGIDQNYVRVKRSWTDLENRVRHLQQWDPMAERIARNSIRLFRERHLTPAAEMCYWRRLFRGWASVADWEAQLFDAPGRSRGVPFDEFISTEG